MRERESLRIVADAPALAREGAEQLRLLARAARAARGAFHLALAGGSTPRGVYRELVLGAPPEELAPWHLWFGDERCVPPDHPDSNFRMVRESGLVARVPAAHVHRLLGEAPDPRAEAERYGHELTRVLGQPPRLDAVLLGMGADGHTASLFPDTQALRETSWVAVGAAPGPPITRLTLTLATLAEARAVIFLVAGEDKAPALLRALRALPVPPPAGLVRPREGTVTWLVDRGAARELAAAGLA